MSKIQSLCKGSTILLMLLILIPASATRAQEADIGSAELRSGVIVNLAKSEIYLMRPKSGVEAAELATGQVIWSNSDVSKPLAVSADGLIVCQGEADEVQSHLSLVVIDASESGRRVSYNLMPLSSSVQARIDDSLSSRFEARALVQGNDGFIAWQYETQTIQGLPPSPNDSTRSSPQALHPQQGKREISGMIRMNLRSGNSSTVDATEVPQAMQRAFSTEAVTATSTKRVSVDGLHTLMTKRIADEHTWAKYQWTITETSSGEVVGTIRSHLGDAAFIVVDSLVLFVTEAYVRRLESGEQRQPLAIRAYSLQTSDEVWNRQVRDTKYRGPFPP